MCVRVPVNVSRNKWNEKRDRQPWELLLLHYARHQEKRDQKDSHGFFHRCTGALNTWFLFWLEITLKEDIWTVYSCGDWFVIVMFGAYWLLRLQLHQQWLFNLSGSNNFRNFSHERWCLIPIELFWWQGVCVSVKREWNYVFYVLSCLCLSWLTSCLFVHAKRTAFFEFT